ncbi:MAG: glutamine amidotransferase [Myxococcota bacterium]|jgi:glutamine amidotransferase
MSPSTRVTVVDHGAGNIRSVVRALTHVGANVQVSADPDTIASADRLVVPGQGAFGDCMTRLRAQGLVDPITAHIRAERPYLGICLGLQVLFDVGREHGEHQGLGVLAGECIPLPRAPGLKIPHMGWNQIHGTALGSEADGAWFYFVHGFHVVPDTQDCDATTTDYGGDFVSAVTRGNLMACQFHPEKSQEAGLGLLRRFLAS